MSMDDLERRALLGDRQAQDECTRQGIALPGEGWCTDEKRRNDFGRM